MSAVEYVCYYRYVIHVCIRSGHPWESWSFQKTGQSNTQYYMYYVLSSTITFGW